MVWLVADWLQHVEEFRRLEDWFGHKGRDEMSRRYEDAIGALQSGGLDAWLSESGKAGVSEKSFEHFRDHWVGGEMFPWVDSDRLIARMTDGFLAALTEARDQRLPISFAWVSFEGIDPGFFDVGHVAGANAVTVIIATPRPQPAASGR